MFCYVRGMPPPSIAWSKVSILLFLQLILIHNLKKNCFQDNYPLYESENDGRVVLQENNQKLLIKFSRKEDDGYYQCNVKNKFGGTSLVFRLCIKGE